MVKLRKILLDTGVWALFFSHPRPKSISSLIQGQIRGEYTFYSIKHVILELSTHLTKIYGANSARAMILSSIQKFDIKILELEYPTYISAGIFQYKHKPTLSACDSLLVQLALIEKLKLHTTDKKMISSLNSSEKKELTYRLHNF